MGLIKKIKDNLPSKDDERHKEVEKSNYEEPLILSCKCLSDYVKDDVLYNRYLYDKFDDNFIGKLFEIQEDCLINKEIYNYLMLSCFKKSRFSKMYN